MEGSPFAADPKIAHRQRDLAPDLVPAVAERVTTDRRVPGSDVDTLIRDLGLTGTREVMLAAVPVAEALADAPISGYRVGAVGRETASGDLLLGANIEIPGGRMADTLHAEAVVAIRAFGRGASIGSIALRQARPCGHCRQFLSEFAWISGVRFVDTLGHDLAIADLFPWPFGPRDLDGPGAVPGVDTWPDLAIADPKIPVDVAAALVAAGRRAHAPYSRAPAAAAFRLRDGDLSPGRPSNASPSTRPSDRSAPPSSPCKRAGMAMLTSRPRSSPSGKADHWTTSAPRST